MGKYTMRLKFFLLLILSVLLAEVQCYAQDSLAAEVTPEAIQTRIRKYRMGNIIIKTKPGVSVKIQQLRHEFKFGTAIPDQLAENASNSFSPETRKKFIEVLSNNFNYAVHENALKWYDNEKEKGTIDYSVADRIWQICDSLDIPMRGHTIFWAKDRFNQPWVKQLNNDELRAVMNRRARSVTKHFKGRIEEFDLNNEMIDGHFYRRRFGYGIINEMAYMALAGNPDARLCVNDYGIVDAGYHTDAYVTQIKNLLANGVPISGIGCQGHLSISADSLINSPVRVQKQLDKLSQFHLPIKITECLFVFDDEQIQARELRKLFPVYFADPDVKAIIMWGFWAGNHWIPKSAMYRKDWSPRPQANAYRDLVYNKWWTKISDKADGKGNYQTKAFYGDYKITSNGVTQKISLLNKNKTVTVNFK